MNERIRKLGDTHS